MDFDSAAAAQNDAQRWSCRKKEARVPCGDGQFHHGDRRSLREQPLFPVDETIQIQFMFTAIGALGKSALFPLAKMLVPISLLFLALG
jgi:hypothetical protein